ncbi:MAG: branched-chain amino acid ABC transporter substrate-binding protein [Mycobacteriaceae bacterium]
MHRRTLGGALTVAIAAFLTVSACSSNSTSTSSLAIEPQVQIDPEGNTVPVSGGSAAVDPTGTGNATCSSVSLAMAGALTGPDAALGINIVNGAQLAIDKHNKANVNCQVSLKRFDTEGDAQKASQVAPQIVSDSSVIGLLGPAFSGENKATGQIFNDAGLVATTASATNATLTSNGWKTFFRGLANDDVQGPAVAKYLVKTLNYKKVCVIDDSTDYGVGLAKAVKEALGGSLTGACTGSVKKGDKDFSATVAGVSSASPDAIFFAGYYAEAAPLAQQLKSGGVSAAFVAADGANDPQFISGAGDSAKDAILSCPCGPAPAAFKTEYKEAFNTEPGVYSVEAYDLTTILLKGIDEGKTDRASLLDYVRNYSGTGLARQYKWSENGELASSLIWVYKVQ